MLKTAGAIALAGGLALLAGCGPRTPPPTINASMTQVMAPNAQTVWDTTSRAFNARGDGLDSAKLTAADWAQLEKAGQAMQARALVMAMPGHVTVAGPRETIMGAEAAQGPSKVGTAWDAASAKEIQARIDADPALFSERAKILAQAGEAILTASRTRDAKKLYDVSSNLDEVCDGCHAKFWGTDEPPPFPK